MVLLISTCAVAARFTAEDLGSAALALRPRIEATTGKTFDHLPALVLGTTDDAWPGIERDLRAANRDLPEDQIAAKLRAERQHLSHFLALYDPEADEIHVFADVIEASFRDGRADDGLLIPLMWLVLSHELTHALQHQVLDPTLHDDQLAEGHATWVAEQIGLDDGAEAAVGLGRAMLATVMVSDWRGDIPPGVLAYGVARELMAQAAATGGPAAQWELFAHPPVLSDVVLASDPALPPTEAVDAVCVALGSRVTATDSGAMLLGAVVSQVDRDALRALVHVEGQRSCRSTARAATLRDEGPSVGVVVVRLSDPADAQSLVAGRRLWARRDQDRRLARYAGGMYGWREYAYKGFVRPFQAMRREAPVDDALKYALVHGLHGRYVEYWAIRGDRLVYAHLEFVGRSPRRVAAAIAPLLDPI